MWRKTYCVLSVVALGSYFALGVDAQSQVGGIFFNEGWESGAATQSFNSSWFGNAQGPQFTVQNQIFGSGSWSIRHRLSAGMTGDDVAYATQHFGDSPATPVWPTGAGQHFYDLYVQYKVFYSTNWNTSPGGLVKGIEIGTQDERVHNEVCCNPGFANYIGVYPAFGQDWAVEMVNKEGPTANWILFRQNSSGYSSTNRFVMQTGRWYTIEVRRRLNDAGVDNGILQLWVDGTLLLDYRNVRFRVPSNGQFGTNFLYGTNLVMLSEYGPSDRDESVYYDDFKLSTTYIGGGLTSLPSPLAPSNVRVIRTGI